MRISTHVDVYEPSDDDYRLFIANLMIYVFVSFRPPYLCGGTPIEKEGGALRKF